MQSFEPIEYQKEFEPLLIEFLEQCLPESGRALDLQTRHGFYLDIEHSFKAFWCMFDSGKIIGAVGVKELDNASCELKSLYLLERYHGKGYGKCLLGKAIDYVKRRGMEGCILTPFPQAQRQSGCTADLVFLTRRDTTKMNARTYLWCWI